MASIAIGSLCKPTSRRFSSTVVSSSSFSTGSKAAKFLHISNSTKNSSLRLQQRHSNKNMKHIFFEPLALDKMNKDKFKLNASSTNNPQFDATHDLNNPIESVINFVDVLYRFIRPYAAIGTVLSVAAMSLLTLNGLSDFTPLFFTKALQALVGGMLMQMYVCGFNQICDIELDKVNKPYLPLAAGELSMTTAIIVSSLSAIMSLAVGWLVSSPPLFWGLVGWFIVGTAYSANVLPYLRWKRFPFTAAFYMLMARALVVPIGYYLHMQNSIYGVSTLLSRPILFAVAMLSAFSVSTIFFKDIPDIEGDRMHGIKSLAIKLGEKKMYWICIWILEIAYIAAAFAGATSPISWSRYVTIISHLGMGLLLLARAKSVDLKNMKAVQSMYMFLWQLFYAEYGLIALVR
ncbi:homogentisate phytyltransferase 1, chloroplastic-like [Rutidosis leptorrhynchoides]|uniref:homogentisate phytyltransferase 1, chloroplastic-like n=1 Tax=Rutidosis leptorrhynchoides TaxID=125765 RepID=UPI003A98E870